MTFANVGTLGAVPGKRDELVAHLTQRSGQLADGDFRFDVIGSPLRD